MSTEARKRIRSMDPLCRRWAKRAPREVRRKNTKLPRPIYVHSAGERE